MGSQLLRGAVLIIGRFILLLERHLLGLVGIHNLDSSVKLLLRPESGTLLDFLQSLQQLLRGHGACDGDLLLPLVTCDSFHILQVQELLLDRILTFLAAQRHHEMYSLKGSDVVSWLKDARAGRALSILSRSLDNLCALGNWRHGCNGAIAAFLSEVLRLVGVCHHRTWRPVDSPCNLLRSYHGVRHSVALHVWVASVCKSVIRVNSVRVAVVVRVIVGVRALESGVMWVHNPGRLNWPVEQLRSKSQV